ncbi:MAG: secretin N-terminal domain-containing protein [Nanoarchaeota archaeon]|nr:secretin N-terminal domain-containing protein [Nanoarchaeota archaeon]
MKTFLWTILIAMAFTFSLLTGCEKKPAEQAADVNAIGDANATEEIAEQNEVTAVATEPGAAERAEFPRETGRRGGRTGGAGGRTGGFDPVFLLKNLDPNDLEKLKKSFPNLDFSDPNALRENQNVMSALRDIARARGGFGGAGSGGIREPNQPADPNFVFVNLKDVEIKNVIQQISEWTGKIIIPNEELMKQRITIYSPTLLSKEQALETIYTTLNERGYTRVEDANSIILKKIAQAKFEAVPVIDSNVPLASLKDKSLIVQKTFQLKSYSPAQMSLFIQPLIGQYGQIISDEASRKLLVIETVGNLIRLEKIIQQLDIPETGLGTILEIFLIEHGDPEKIVRLLNQLLGTETTTGITRRTSDRFGGGFGGRGSESQQTSQAAESRSATAQRAPSTTIPAAGMTPVSISATRGVIILIPEIERRWIIARANSGDMETIREWIKKLDVEKGVESQMEIVLLKYASPTEVETAIDNNVREMPIEIRPIISVEALELQKQVMITGSREAREYVKKLIESIDIPTPILPSKTWQLKYLDIDELKTHLQETYRITDTTLTRGRTSFFGGGFRGGETAAAEEIYVSTFPSRREITVRASESTLKQIDELIKNLDQSLKFEMPRIIELRNTDPIEMVTMLSRIFGSQLTTRTTSTRNLMQMMFGGGSEGTTEKIVGKWYGKVLFNEVPGAKKIIIVATNPEAYDEIIPWVTELDKAELSELPKVVVLKYADPEDLSERLNAMFNEPGTQARIRRAEKGIEYTIQQEETTATTGTTAQQQATATTDYTPWWSGSGARTTVQQEMPISNIIGKIRLVPDPRMKAIMVLAPLEYMEGIVSLINELDKPGKQVMIEAIIVEVDQSKLDNIGTQFASDPTAFGGLNENSINALFEPTQQQSHGSMTFGAAKTSGSSFKLNAGADINVLIDLLVKYTDAKVINKQSVYTRDNANAEFFKGEEIAFESASTVTTGGTVTRSYEYKEVGITLRVRPNITPEKNVDMIIDLALSQLSKDLVNTQPRTPRTRNTSTMIVKDGQTILLGSILTQKDSDIRRKIPLLGDIPIIGGLFSHRNSFQSNNEMLVFITPHVVDEEINPEKVIPEFNPSIDKMERISKELAEPWLEKVE